MAGLFLDDDIEVVVVYPDGKAVIYDSVDAFRVRKKIYDRQFSHYGAAKLWAQEREELARVKRPLARR